MYIGDIEIEKIYVGDQLVDSVYIGDLETYINNE